MPPANSSTSIEPSAASHVARRVVLHFPGFEPLSAVKHRERYERALRSTAQLWGLEVDVGALIEGEGCPRFDVRTVTTAGGEGEIVTESRVFVLDHDRIVAHLAQRPLETRLWRGFLSAARVIGEGGAVGYFRHAWRFGLFFVFPFLLVLLGMAVGLGLATYPWWLGLGAWQYPVGIALGLVFFLKLFVPWSERLHTLHLFSDWEMAVATARMDDPVVNGWIEDAVGAARVAFDEGADEYLITSHSMGSSMAVHVVGSLLQREPGLFAGKRVVFMTLGGAVLQCSLLRSADVLRARVGAIANNARVTFVEVQCLTDIISFYKSSLTRLTGHADAPAAGLIFLRFRNMLTAERYKRIKRDFLRVHRQYVLASDRKSAFDFGLLTAGPVPAACFELFTHAGSYDEALAEMGEAVRNRSAADGVSSV